MVESEEIFVEEDKYHFSYRRVSEIECEFRAFCADAVVVGSNGKLAAEVADGIIIEGDRQLQLNGHASLTVTEIPDPLRSLSERRPSSTTKRNKVRNARL